MYDTEHIHVIDWKIHMSYVDRSESICGTHHANPDQLEVPYVN